MLIKPVYLSSSNISAAGWKRGTLFIKFSSGSSYSYTKVGYSIFRDLVAADSPGHFFHCHIKQNSALKYTKLTDDPFAVVHRAKKEHMTCSLAT